MPIVTVEMFEGRSIDQKRDLVASLTSETARIVRCREDDVQIVIREVKREDWGISGELACDRS